MNYIVAEKERTNTERPVAESLFYLSGLQLTMFHKGHLDMQGNLTERFSSKELVESVSAREGISDTQVLQDMATAEVILHKLVGNNTAVKASRPLASALQTIGRLPFLLLSEQYLESDGRMNGHFNPEKIVNSLAARSGLTVEEVHTDMKQSCDFFRSLWVDSSPSAQVGSFVNTEEVEPKYVPNSRQLQSERMHPLQRKYR